MIFKFEFLKNVVKNLDILNKNLHFANKKVNFYDIK